MTKHSAVSRMLCCWAVLLGVIGAFGQSQPVVRHQRAGGDDLWGIASGPAGLVAVGTNGAILQSTDGQTWTRRVSGTTDWLTAVAFGNGRYLAVGDHGHILASPDGVTWTTVPQTATTQRLNNVLFYGGFIAVGEAGTIVRSEDGVVWVADKSGTTHWLRGLAWGDHIVVAGEAGTVLISSGMGWIDVSSALHMTTDFESAAPISSLSGDSIFNFSHTDQNNFALTGSAGGVALLHFYFNDTYNRDFPFIDSASFVFQGATRFRCLVSGPLCAPEGFANQFGGRDTLKFAAPLSAVDQSGQVFSTYDINSDWTTFPLPASTSWQQEPAGLTTAMNAGVYFAAQESFYFVGNGETIAQRDQVFDGRLGNISTRGVVDRGDKTLIAGFVVKGATPKSVLVRGVGPALASFGVRTALAHPLLTIYDAAGAVVATNAGWSTGRDPAEVVAKSTLAGAFTFAAGSGDDALVLTLPPGAYTAQVATTEATPGIALIEVYDLDARVNGTSRAINLSTRGQVLAGDDVLIVGLNVRGPSWRTFLVRAVGPTLTNFGVAGALADPVITVSSSLVFPASNAISISREAGPVNAAMQTAGAFALAPKSLDDVMVVTLPPANYTFAVASKSGGSGVALLEVYEIGVAK